ncbi:MAG TPA: DUF2752 domain-containing protein [Prolixibacteraceae bacterium]|nr:DUF2752 domain-containing protein [Prolixibacteraceae bacterium]
MKANQLSVNQIIRISSIFILLVIVELIPREILFDETKVVCIHKYLFGFQCPLCGMTRAVYEFTHLHFASAVNYNVVVGLLPLYLVIDISSIFFRQNWLLTLRKTVVVLIFAGLLVLYTFRFANHFCWI